MDIQNVDLNLLLVLHAMDAHRSVTKAAASIGLSQPAMSAAVARLRVLFNDPLYVKTGAVMSPTPRALALAGSVKQVVKAIREDILQESSFDPRVAERRFAIVMPDIAEANILPRIVRDLATSAPRVRLHTFGVAVDRAADALENGAADLAIGYFPDLQRNGFVGQRLFRSEYVCMAREGHRDFPDGLGMAQFLAASHAVVSPGGREHVLEKFLRENDLKRNVALEVSNFMSLLPIIAATDLLATVPLDLAELLAAHSSIRLFKTPFPSPKIDVQQLWHRRLHGDAGHIWLRRHILSLFPG